MIGQSGLFIQELEKRMSNKITKLEKRRSEIIRNIQLCKENKERIARIIINLKAQYKQGAISYANYESKLNSILKQRTPEQWIEYYDNCIEHYKSDLRRYEKEINSEETKIKILPIAIIFMIVLGIGIGLVVFKPEITGFAVYNETSNVTEMLNETLSNITLIENITGIENITYIENITKLSKWYSAIKKDLKEEGTHLEIINESGVDAIVIDSKLLTESGAWIYSEPIVIDKNNYKIKLDHKMLRQNMNDSAGEMIIDYYNETDLIDSSVLDFNETGAEFTYGYEVGLNTITNGDWTILEINIKKQKDINKIRIAVSHNMGLDYSPHYYLIKEIELK